MIGNDPVTEDALNLLLGYLKFNESFVSTFDLGKETKLTKFYVNLYLVYSASKQAGIQETILFKALPSQGGRSLMEIAYNNLRRKWNITTPSQSAHSRAWATLANLVSEWGLDKLTPLFHYFVTNNIRKPVQ